MATKTTHGFSFTLDWLRGMVGAPPADPRTLSPAAFRKFLITELKRRGWRVQLYRKENDIAIVKGSLALCMLPGAEYYNPSFRTISNMLTGRVRWFETVPFLKNLLVIVISQFEEMESLIETTDRSRFVFLHWTDLDYLDLLLAAPKPGASLSPEARAWMTSAVARNGALCRQFSTQARDAGDLAAAAEWAERAITLGAKDPRGYNLLLALHLGTGNIEQAVQVAARAEAQDVADSVTLRHRATLAMRLGDYAKALDTATGIIAEFPDDAAAHHILALVYSKTGQKQAARAAAAEAVRLGPDNARFRQTLLNASAPDQASSGQASSRSGPEA